MVEVQCRQCGAPIEWAILPSTGRRIALDRDPVHDGGAMVLERRGDGVPFVAFTDGGDRRVHASVCRHTSKS